MAELKYLLDTSTCIDNLVVATHNTKHFIRIEGLLTEDWLL